MPRAIVFTSDLLFGSSLVGALSAGGYAATMCPNLEALEVEGAGSACVIVDLTDQVSERLEDLAAAVDSGALSGAALIGYYSHVEPQTRSLGLAAGLAGVFPRSRMHREPAALVDAAVAGTDPAD